MLKKTFPPIPPKCCLEIASLVSIFAKSVHDDFNISKTGSSYLHTVYDCLFFSNFSKSALLTSIPPTAVPFFFRSKRFRRDSKPPTVVSIFQKLALCPSKPPTMVSIFEKPALYESKPTADSIFVRQRFLLQNCLWRAQFFRSGALRLNFSKAKPSRFKN